MRISSLQIFNIADSSMAKMNQQVVATQEQMSTGKRVLTPADDPVAATKIMQITQELAGIEQYNKNIDIARNTLALEEAALSTVTNLIQRTQELAVAAANTATLSVNEYQIMAREVDEQLKELVNLVNTKNANGDYEFTISFWMYPHEVGGNNPAGKGSATLVIANGHPGDGGSANWWFEYWNPGNFEFKS